MMKKGRVFSASSGSVGPNAPPADLYTNPKIIIFRKRLISLPKAQKFTHCLATLLDSQAWPLLNWNHLAIVVSFIKIEPEVFYNIDRL